MDKKISYCPRCDKYVERFVWFCPFCGGMVPKVSVWEKWDEAKRQEFFKDSPHYDPPKPIEDKAELEKAEAFDKLVDVAIWGWASRKPGKQFKCKNCGYEW